MSEKLRGAFGNNAPCDLWPPDFAPLAQLTALIAVLILPYSPQSEINEPEARNGHCGAQKLRSLYVPPDESG